MNDMTHSVSPLERFSAGEITRNELGRQLGKDIAFGEALMMLHAEKLPLPRRIPKYDSGGVAMLKGFLKR
jgi:hypothetical protein